MQDITISQVIYGALVILLAVVELLLLYIIKVKDRELERIRNYIQKNKDDADKQIEKMKEEQDEIRSNYIQRFENLHRSISRMKEEITERITNNNTKVIDKLNALDIKVTSVNSYSDAIKVLIEEIKNKN